MFDEETEELAARARARGRVPAGVAAAPDGLEDRDDAARQRGGRAERAEHDGPRHRLPGRCSRWRRGAGLGDDLVVQTPYGDSGQTTFFIADEGDWTEHERKIVGRADQGDEADRAARARDRGRDHAARHAGRAADGRAHRVPGAHAVRRRLVRQRRLAGAADREAAAHGARAHDRDGRAAAAGGLPGLLRARLPARRRHRRDVARRAEPARHRRVAASRTSRRSPTATCRCSCSTCWSSWTSTTRSMWTS